MTIGKFFYGELEPTTTVGGCIDIYENCWPNPEDTINMIEEQVLDPDSGVKWNRAQVIGLGINQSARTNLDMPITWLAETTQNAAVQNVHNQMNVLLTSALINYKKRYGIAEELWHEGYNMLKYRGGDEYTAHYDGGTSTKRQVSAIIYLNNDYEGGEVEFVNFKIKIKPEPGMMLIFPSNYPYRHIAHPVKSGTKYALVTWTHDQPQ